MSNDIDLIDHCVSTCGGPSTKLAWDRLKARWAYILDRLPRDEDDICQTLGKALGYPWFKDDQVNFPGATEENGVCVGEHVAASIAAEAARKFSELEAELEAAQAQREILREDRDNLGRTVKAIGGEIDRLKTELEAVRREIEGEKMRADTWRHQADAWQVRAEEAQAALDEANESRLKVIDQLGDTLKSQPPARAGDNGEPDDDRPSLAETFAALRAASKGRFDEIEDVAAYVDELRGNERTETPARAGEPVVSYNADGNQIEVLIPNVNFYGKHLGHAVTLYLRQEDDSIIGFCVGNISKPPERDGELSQPDPTGEAGERDFWGRVVRMAWTKWAEQQPNPKPSWLVPYDELSEPDKEADRQIAEAVLSISPPCFDHAAPSPPPSRLTREIAERIVDAIATSTCSSDEAFRDREWVKARGYELGNLFPARVEFVERVLGEGQAAPALDNVRLSLEHNGLWDEFGKYGCDAIDWLCTALLDARGERARAAGAIQKLFLNGADEKAWPPGTHYADRLQPYVDGLFERIRAAEARAAAVGVPPVLVNHVTLGLQVFAYAADAARWIERESPEVGCATCSVVERFTYHAGLASK